jgi:cytochrome c oxidase subunit 2
MIGWIEAMEPADFQAWLAGGATEGSLASSGEKLFQDLACSTCHRPDSQGRGPVLDGLFGKTVSLQSGATVTADEGYIRESILNPQVRVVAGYQPIMPTFQGLISEEGLLQLIAYIKSLAARPGVPAAAPGSASVVAPAPGGGVAGSAAPGASTEPALVSPAGSAEAKK